MAEGVRFVIMSSGHWAVQCRQRAGCSGTKTVGFTARSKIAVCLCRETGLSSSGEKKERKGFVTPQDTNVHGDALCFMGKTLNHRNSIGQRLADGGSWRLAFGGGWRLAVGGWWRLAADGSWRLAVGGGWWSLGAVLKGRP